MSEFAQNRPVKYPNTKTRMTLLDLRKAFGKLEIVAGSPEAPLRIIRTSMGDRQVFVWESGRGSSAVFVCDRER